MSSVEDSPLSKVSQATIETPPETERSSLEADKLFLSARPHGDLPDMTQSLHAQARLPGLHSMQYTMPPPEMTQSLHAQVSRENNMQSMQSMQPPANTADQLAHLQMLQRLSLQQPGYQFIEDYENISPRLIHNANLMHHLNTFNRTSLLGKILYSQEITFKFNRFFLQ